MQPLLFVYSISNLTKQGLHIIHLSHRQDRMSVLMEELRIQNIKQTRIWEGIIDEHFPTNGILKAHQQVVLFAKQTRLKQITIAEDDIRFTAKLAYDHYLSNQPEDFDIYLGGITWGVINEDRSVFDFSGTSLYTIRERFYNAFLALQPGLDFDRQLAGRGKFIVCDPMVALQHDGYSDNQKRHIDFGPLYRRKKWFTG